MRRTLLALVALLALAPAAAAKNRAALSAETTTAVVSAREAVQQAFDEGSAQGILAARAQLEAVAGRDVTAAPVRYTLALADWRVVPLLLEAGKKDQIARYVTDGLAQSRALQAQLPKDGEPYAFEASFVAFQLMDPGADVMTLGPQAFALFAKAGTLSPASPRVQLLRGIFTFFTPPQFGGGADAARPLLEKAATLAASEPPADPLAPRWGRSDALVWLALAALSKQDTAAAHARLGEALALRPGSMWARSVLASLSGAADSSAAVGEAARAAGERAAAKAAQKAGEAEAEKPAAGKKP